MILISIILITAIILIVLIVSDNQKLDAQGKAYQDYLEEIEEHKLSLDNLLRLKYQIDVNLDLTEDGKRSLIQHINYLMKVITDKHNESVRKPKF